MMTMRAVLEAFAFPETSRVDQRVPKKLFLEQGAPTSADKRLLQDGVEEVMWIAALKPETVGVPAFQDESRTYQEVAVLAATFRTAGKAARLIELIHRAVPYPLLLVTEQDGATTISTAHKRSSLGETDKTVLDGDVVAVATDVHPEISTAFIDGIALERLPSANLFSLYSALTDRLHALEAARLTGRYTVPQTPNESAGRLQALNDHVRLSREVATLRAKVAKETQINRRVDLNLAIQRLEGEIAGVLNKLRGTP